MISDQITFDRPMETCPVCEGDDIRHEALRSKKGLMSLPGIPHSFCQGCRSYFVNPQPTDDSLDDFYKSQATEETVEKNILQGSVDRYFQEEARQYFIENRVRPIQKYVARGSRVLDIGCGAGVFVRYMRDFGYKAQGIDISPRSISFGREKLELKKDLHLAHWSDFPGQDYDLITAWTLIEHLKDPPLFLKTVSSMLSPAGHLLIEFPTVDSLLFEHLQDGFFWVMPYYHLFLFSRGGMKRMIERCGFDLVEEHSMPRNWYLVESVCKSQGLDMKEMDKAPSFSNMTRQIDRIFDDIALELDKSSTIQFICRKKT